MIRKFDSARRLKLAQGEQVTRLQMVPTMMIALINHPEFGKHDLSSVKHVMMGGAPTNTAWCSRSNRRFRDAYHGGIRSDGDFAGPDRRQP